MPHAARRPRSWLIFDVGQKMMRDIDKIIAEVVRALPAVAVRQHSDAGACGDDGIWWFSLPGVQPDIQVESSSGSCPFVVETEEQSSSAALRASTIEQAVQLIVEYLSTASTGRSVQLSVERVWP